MHSTTKSVLRIVAMTLCLVFFLSAYWPVRTEGEEDLALGRSGDSQQLGDSSSEYEDGENPEGELPGAGEGEEPPPGEGPETGVPVTPREDFEYETVVHTHLDLANALTDQTLGATRYITLGSNIEMTGQINIYSGITEVVLDGGSRDRVLAEAGSGDNVINASTAAGSLTNVTLKNMTIVGKSYRGTFYIHDANYNVYLLYDNVKYTGPQVTYNRDGTAHYRNCDITIARSSGSNDAEEVSESTHVVLEGRVEIDQTAATSVNEVFYLRMADGTVTVLADAQVTIRAKNNIFYAEGNAFHYFTLEPGASFTAVAAGFEETLQLKNLLVDAGARLHLTFTGNPAGLTRARIYISSSLTVEEDAVFYVERKADTSAEAPYLLAIDTNAHVAFNNPRSVTLIQGYPTSILWGGAASTATVTAQQINYWDAIDENYVFSGTLPAARWTSAGETAEMDVSVGTQGYITAVNSWSGFLHQEEPPDLLLLAFRNYRVFSAGRHERPAGDPYFYRESSYTGTAAPGAQVVAMFQNPDEDQAVTDWTLAEDSKFSVSLDALGAWPYPGTELHAVARGSENNYLFGTSEPPVVAQAGPLELVEYPETIQLERTALAPTARLVRRSQEQAVLSYLVRDRRGPNHGKSWRLTLQVSAPLAATLPQSGTRVVLEDVLMFSRNGNLALIPASGAGELEIHNSGETLSRVYETSVRWNGVEEGVVASIPTGAAYADVRYTGTLLWTLAEVP